jgi:hypothetical protein
MEKVALRSITVVRDGKSQIVAPGTTFDFTADELKEFKAAETAHKKSEDHLSVKTPFRAIVRDPKNESATEVEGDAGEEPEEAEVTKPKPKGRGRNAEL